MSQVSNAKFVAMSDCVKICGVEYVNHIKALFIR